jgi:hypothetical protein
MEGTAAYKIKNKIIFVSLPHEAYLMDVSDPANIVHYYLEDSESLIIAILSALCQAMHVGKNAVPPTATAINVPHIFQAIGKFFTGLTETMIQSWLEEHPQFVETTDAPSVPVFFGQGGQPTRPADFGRSLKELQEDMSHKTFGRPITFSWPWPYKACCG